MPSKAIVIGFGLVITIAVVSLVEIAVPLRPKSMNACQNALLRMETEEGLRRIVMTLLKSYVEGLFRYNGVGYGQGIKERHCFSSVRANYVQG